jgi:methionyl-tRNA formyltransferase
MNNFNKEIQFKISLFINGERGHELIKFLVKKKIVIKKIFLSKKFLNKSIIKRVNKFNIPTQIIGSLKKNNIKKILKKMDLAIICGFPYIFPKDLLKLPKYGMINCHAGKLPKYRGGSPLNWQIINREKYIGLSVIKMSRGIDEGKIINEIKFLNKNYNILEAHKITNSLFPKLVLKSISDLIKNKKLKTQNNKNAKYWKQRTKNDSLFLPKITSPLKVLAMIKALNKPYPSPYFIDGKKKITIMKAITLKKKIKPGLTKYNKKSIILGCKDGSLKLISFKIKYDEKKNY